MIKAEWIALFLGAFAATLGFVLNSDVRWGASKLAGSMKTVKIIERPPQVCIQAIAEFGLISGLNAEALELAHEAYDALGGLDLEGIIEINRQIARIGFLLGSTQERAERYSGLCLEAADESTLPARGPSTIPGRDRAIEVLGG